MYREPVCTTKAVCISRFGANHNWMGLDNMHVRSGGILVHLEQVVHHDMDPETEHDISQKSVDSCV
jgi:hypothetical protein